MYINNNILVGRGNNTDAVILTNMANRHGLITGASGSGKTITLKVMAESFSDAGIPVFLSDVKGDLAGMCLPGINNENINERLNKLNIDNFEFKSFPTTFWDVFKEAGLPIRTTVESLEYKLLSCMLGLTEIQEGNLAIVFKIAKDNNWPLIDLKDLRLALQYIADNKDEYSLEYGNITSQSIGVIQRKILELQSQNGDYFFGNPKFDIMDLIKFDAQTGKGNINILHAIKLYQKPKLYSVFLLFLLNELFNKLPEVGDLDKPKIIFFFDEAHLLFEEMPDYMIKEVIQSIKLIRSKGIGLYFISQSPKDIPDEVLSQLGNRIQHTLRTYTPAEEKIVKAAAMSFRVNPNFDTEEAIKTLGIGEALVSFLNESGEPSIVEKVTILPPQSMMGTIDSITRSQIMSASMFKDKYPFDVTEEESAYEILYKKQEEIENEKKELEEQKLQEKLDKEKEKKEKEEEKARKNNPVNKLGKKITNKAVDKVINKGLNSIFKNLFK